MLTMSECTRKKLYDRFGTPRIYYKCANCNTTVHESLNYCPICHKKIQKEDNTMAADEKTCETCKHEDKRLDQEPCLSCDVETASGWEIMDADEYVKEVFRKRYDKQH